MKKILLVSPSAEEPDGRIDPPLGLCYLSAMLDKSKYNVYGRNYLGMKWEAAEKKILADLEEIQPEVIGIQCLTYNRTACFKLIKLIRENIENVIIIMGGIHATLFHEKIVSEYPVDFVTRGESEYTFKELLDALDDIEKIPLVKGITYTLGDKVIVNEDRPLLENLDELPFPDLSIFDEQYKKCKRVKLYSSRGCLFRCNFCSSAHFWQNSWRGRSVKNVLEELENTHTKYPDALIDFSDEYFTKDWNRVKEICEEIIKRNLEIRWICETRVTGATLEMFKLMKQAGCENISLGVESGSMKIIKVIGKGITMGQVESAFKWAHEAGLNTGLLLMVGQPGETQETINESKELIKKLYKYTELQEVAPLWVFPGTPIYDDIKKKGLMDDGWWFENEGIPYYTYEHSYEKLREWATEIVMYNHSLKGTKYLITYAVKGFIHHPIKFIRFFVKRKYYKFLFKPWSSQ